MKMKIFKLVLILMIILNIFGTFQYVYADDGIGDIMREGKEFIDSADGDVLDQGDVKQFSDNIFSAFMAVGMVIAVAVGTILGIQYMFSTVEEKAKSKQHLVVYVIGCAVLLGSFGIWKMVVELFNNL